MNDKPFASMKRTLRVTYAKREEKQRIKANVAAARVRLQKKQRKAVISDNTGKRTIVEGKRSRKSKSGGSGFKLGKKRGKMRLLEHK